MPINYCIVCSWKKPRITRIKLRVNNIMYSFVPHLYIVFSYCKIYLLLLLLNRQYNNETNFKVIDFFAQML